MDDLKPLVKKEVETMGFYLYEMRFNKRGKDYVLSIEIDHKDPISIDDCVKVSDHLSDILDAHDPIETAYMLEVSSAGAEHPLRTTEEMQRAVGKFVHLLTSADAVHEGTLISVNTVRVEILDKDKRQPISINLDDIKTMRLAIEF